MGTSEFGMVMHPLENERSVSPNDAIFSMECCLLIENSE
jgi:hypothetical protein